MSWPDLTQPGKPLNPDVSGWHWLSVRNNIIPFEWCAGFGQWWLDGSEDYGGGWQYPTGLSSYYSYVGPCHTPSEVASLIAAEREACAQICNTADVDDYPDQAQRDAAFEATRFCAHLIWHRAHAT